MITVQIVNDKNTNCCLVCVNGEAKAIFHYADYPHPISKVNTVRILEAAKIKAFDIWARFRENGIAAELDPKIKTQ